MLIEQGEHPYGHLFDGIDEAAAGRLQAALDVSSLTDKIRLKESRGAASTSHTDQEKARWNSDSVGGRYWDRTSDLFRVKEALSH